MYLPISYDIDFDTLMMHLRAKYPTKLFDLDGIGKQIDLSDHSREFFSNKSTADVSVDSNANVDDRSVITYNTELPKPLFRLNSYYVLWKKIRQLYGHEKANQLVEKALTGDIYINDFHGLGGGFSYSYHPHTMLCLKINKKVTYISMEDLFKRFEKNVTKYDTYEEINFINMLYPIKIDYPKNTGNTQHLITDFKHKKIEILSLDENNNWTRVQRVLRHKTDNELIKIGTKNGRTTIVTKNHPVILENGESMFAGDLKLGYKIKTSENKLQFTESQFVNNDFAYLVGFWLGDGWSNKAKKAKQKGSLWICQKNIKSHKIVKIIEKYFNNAKIYGDDKIYFGGTQFYNYFCNDLMMGSGAQDKKLPVDILTWNKSAIKSLICGIIDSDGTINKDNGHISIRVSSFSLIQQVSEILYSLGIDNIRTSHMKYEDYPSTRKIKTKMEMFRVSFRINDDDDFKISDKILENYNMCISEKGKDGRFETNEISFLNNYKNPCTWVYDITTDSGHFHSQRLIQHNCFNYSTFDIMLNGLNMINKIKCIPPKYLYSFKSQLEQFVTIAANSTLGATGLSDLFIVMAHYVDNILETKSDAGFKFASEEDCWYYIRENIVSFIYTINQPMRGGAQSPFTNVSVFDDCFLDQLISSYAYDGKEPKKETIKKLQNMFLDIMNVEMKRSPITFPVTTACFAVDKEKNILDKAFVKLIAEKNKDFGFINLYCGETSTLSSCCRLRSNIDVAQLYSNSIGGSSTKVGSVGVVTVNFPRLAYKYRGNEEEFLNELRSLVNDCARINQAKRNIIQKRIDNGNLPLYSLGFIDLNKQFSTVGVNGLNEAAEIMGYNILNEDGQEFIIRCINLINETNEKNQTQYKYPHNCEQIPGETASVKLAEKDKLLKYQTDDFTYDFYSNQFIPLCTNADMLDRIYLQGLFDSHFSGGAICHINVDTKITDSEKIEKLIINTAKMGVIYFAINYCIQKCEKGHMSVGKNEKCDCGAPITDNYTRVVGYLTNTKSWHQMRREKDFPNRQFYNGTVV